MSRFFGEGPEADLYVTLGDLTQNGAESEYRSVYAIIDSFDRRAFFIHVPGNHDLLEADVARTESWASTSPIKNGFGSIDTDVAKLLFLNTSQTRRSLDWGGRIGQDQLQLLKRKLAEAGEGPLLVFVKPSAAAYDGIIGKRFNVVVQAAVEGEVFDWTKIKLIEDERELEVFAEPDPDREYCIGARISRKGWRAATLQRASNTTKS